MKKLFIICVGLYFIFGVFFLMNNVQFMRLKYGSIMLAIIHLLGIVSVIYFIIDAFLRKYYENRALPIALAIMGLISFGFFTLIYFLYWGWRNRDIEFGSDFCENCIDESEVFEKPLGLDTVNFVNGGRLVGFAKRCNTCGSFISTHCFYLFGMPTYSKGSFRVQCPDTNKYILRKVRFYWPHLFYLLLIPLFILIFALVVYFLNT
jgi:hypothetical protein